MPRTKIDRQKEGREGRRTNKEGSEMFKLLRA